MIVKVIQNLQNKMELQINRLETQTENRQEIFNKDLEEIKNSLSVINNAIIDVIQSPSYVWLCDPMDCNTPGLPVLHHLPQFAQVLRLKTLWWEERLELLR